MELTVTATEGHTFKVDLNELHDLVLADNAAQYSDVDLYYYFAHKVNEALGYTDIWPTDKRRVIPVIQNTAFIHGLEITSPQNKLLFQSIEGDLWCCYAVFRNDTLQYITEHHLQYTLKLSLDELHPLALDNLEAAQTDNLAMDSLDGPLWRIHDVGRFGDAASALLLAHLWEDLKQHFNIGQLAACVPSANNLLFCNGDDEDAVQMLRETSLQMYREAAQPLSKCMLWWNPEELYWQLEPYRRVPDIEMRSRMNRLMGEQFGE
jgi:uncharacterized protein YtpQ (UPF0354 family)